LLQEEANQSVYYKVFPSEEVNINEQTYTGTIRALSGGPLGACQGIASSCGCHPNICVTCDALVHGKSSTLNRKLHRSKLLKHPRSEEQRALFSGVNHKFCSAEHLQAAVRIRKIQEQRVNEKLVSLQASNEKLLHDSWHPHPTAKPFVKTFLSLIESNKLSEFDLNFISTWLGKKDKGKFYKADEQARRLVILFSNKLGEKMYSTTAPLLGILI